MAPRKMPPTGVLAFRRRQAPHGAPADEPFWVASAKGTGTLALDWEPTAGDWRAVVMNADGSRGVTTELEFGARTSLLWCPAPAFSPPASSRLEPRPCFTPPRAQSANRRSRWGSRWGGFPLRFLRGGLGAACLRATWIVEVGSEVTGLKVGDRVVVNPQAAPPASSAAAANSNSCSSRTPSSARASPSPGRRGSRAALRAEARDAERLAKPCHYQALHLH